MTLHLEKWAKEVESKNISFKPWATPGGNLAAAALDVARTVCRRAEGCACELNEAGQLENREITIYLNRSSDLLWLWARQEEMSDQEQNSGAINRQGLVTTSKNMAAKLLLLRRESLQAH
jgi:ATP:cob(I)alamin adenosyltransferase